MRMGVRKKNDDNDRDEVNVSNKTIYLKVKTLKNLNGWDVKELITRIYIPPSHPHFRKLKKKKI